MRSSLVPIWYELLKGLSVVPIDTPGAATLGVVVIVDHSIDHSHEVL